MCNLSIFHAVQELYKKTQHHPAQRFFTLFNSHLWFCLMINTAHTVEHVDARRMQQVFENYMEEDASEVKRFVLAGSMITHCALKLALFPWR